MKYAVMSLTLWFALPSFARSQFEGVENPGVWLGGAKYIANHCRLMVVNYEAERLFIANLRFKYPDIDVPETDEWKLVEAAYEKFREMHAALDELEVCILGDLMIKDEDTPMKLFLSRNY